MFLKIYVTIIPHITVQCEYEYCQLLITWRLTMVMDGVEGKITDPFTGFKGRFLVVLI